MKSVGSNSLRLKYQGFSPSGCQDIGIRKFMFVAKTQFLSKTPKAVDNYNLIQRLNSQSNKHIKYVIMLEFFSCRCTLVKEHLEKY